AFPHVAAKAWGMSAAQLEFILEQAETGSDKSKNAKFGKKIIQAQATARLRAEMEAYDKNPILWLKSGPGKEKPQNPGWTSVVRPHLTAEHKTINLYTSPDFLGFMATLRQVLAPFPDALKALVDIMDGKKPAVAALPPPPPDPPPAIIDIKPSNN